MSIEPNLFVRVSSIEKITKQVKKFTLSQETEKGLPRFSGGAHVSTYLKTPSGLVVRQYSLVSHPDDRTKYEIAVRLCEDSKGGSLYWHQGMKVGDRLQISYPKNHFSLSFKARHHVFYAAGIGITPFLSMMQDFSVNGQTFELHYASKSEDNCAFYTYIKKHYPNQSHFYFSDQQQRLQTASLENHPIGTHVYLCGPEGFIEQFRTSAGKLGYPESSVHYEQFLPTRNKGMKTFKVILQNGSELIVEEKQTLLEVLLANGINIPYSCRVGRCGTCEISVAEGKIEHFDDFLSAEQKNEHNCILACVSRGCSDKLVLKI
ncbi:PDR/VanB family oxidoreductase [Fictibacillus sp. 26RED30]|uniref:PDR/VanB family oxidoreductase n=1 Tax=Fictibacillus sp. 26RED30 TaxID=2745877 RepID=UPI0018CDF0A9|nr:PDR/VanB family oxidoreductase [Fictibacillus sp. 26RED30]MBH0162775.1 oxidoreductase [Fictibacillus sp. 26RED30]